MTVPTVEGCIAINESVITHKCMFHVHPCSNCCVATVVFWLLQREGSWLLLLILSCSLVETKPFVITCMKTNRIFQQQLLLILSSEGQIGHAPVVTHPVKESTTSPARWTTRVPPTCDLALLPCGRELFKHQTNRKDRPTDCGVWENCALLLHIIVCWLWIFHMDAAVSSTLRCVWWWSWWNWGALKLCVAHPLLSLFRHCLIHRWLLLAFCRHMNEMSGLQRLCACCLHLSTCKSCLLGFVSTCGFKSLSLDWTSCVCLCQDINNNTQWDMCVCPCFALDLSAAVTCFAWNGEVRLLQFLAVNSSINISLDMLPHESFCWMQQCHHLCAGHDTCIVEVCVSFVSWSMSHKVFQTLLMWPFCSGQAGLCCIHDICWFRTLFLIAFKTQHEHLVSVLSCNWSVCFEWKLALHCWKLSLHHVCPWWSINFTSFEKQI